MKYGTPESLLCESRARYIGDFIRNGHSEAEAIAALGLENPQGKEAKRLREEIEKRLKYYK